jgi:HEAT repeat protein
MSMVAGGSTGAETGTEPIEARAVARAVDRLRSEVWNEDEARAIRAVRQLRHADCSAATDALCEALARPGRVGLEACHALSDIGSPTVSALLASLSRPDSTARWHAAKALAAIAAPETGPALVDRLEDEDAAVRWEAVYALSAIGLPALPPLLHRLSSGDFSVWFAVGAQRVLRRLAHLMNPLHPERLIADLDQRQTYISASIEAHRLLVALEELCRSGSQP